MAGFAVTFNLLVTASPILKKKRSVFSPKKRIFLKGPFFLEKVFLIL
jgi:hypothetical protein